MMIDRQLIAASRFATTILNGVPRWSCSSVAGSAVLPNFCGRTTLQNSLESHPVSRACLDLDAARENSVTTG